MQYLSRRRLTLCAGHKKIEEKYDVFILLLYYTCAYQETKVALFPSVYLLAMLSTGLALAALKLWKNTVTNEIIRQKRPAVIKISGFNDIR